MIIHDEIINQLPKYRRRILKLIKESGEKIVTNITVNSIFGGMKNLDVLISDISHVDMKKGLYIRNHPISEVIYKLPKATKSNMPYVGGLYYLLMVGEFPTEIQALEVEKEWSLRASKIPNYIFRLISTMPRETHPMTLLSQAVLALQNCSSFEKKYHLEINKDSNWESALEDSLNLTAQLPVIAVYIYRWKYFGETKIPEYSPNLDYAQNLARMIQVSDEKAYANFLRLYFVLHSDHGVGNASAHTMQLVGSTLSSPFYAFSASLNALAGPLHGLANQESLDWLLKILKKFNGIPPIPKLKKFVSEEINSGKIIPGYSHALLKVIDPRFVLLLNYANDTFPNDELVSLTNLIYKIVSSKLITKTVNPYPNIDAISGVLQYHYGITQSNFYTVLFGLSRSLGLTANYVWSRALNFPIERPNSITIKILEKKVKKETIEI